MTREAVKINTTSLPARYHNRVEEIFEALPHGGEWSVLNVNDKVQVHVLPVPEGPFTHFLILCCDCFPIYAGDNDYPIVIHRNPNRC